MAERQNRPPAPAVHHEDAEEVAGDLDNDAQAEVGVRAAGQRGGGEREAVVAHRHREPLEEKKDKVITPNNNYSRLLKQNSTRADF